MTRKYNSLATRSGFNEALRHFKLVNEYAQAIADGHNLADILTEDIKTGAASSNQIVPITHALLHDKFQYHNTGFNFAQTMDSVKKIHNTLSAWRALQIILVYYNPVRGVTAVNPAERTALENAVPFTRHEYALLYVGGVNIDDEKLLKKAVKDVAKVLNGKTVVPQKQYLRGPRKAAPAPAAAPKKAARSDAPPPDKESAPPPAAASGAGYWVTPQHAVTVSNELFHNGNVEAWKKIIESYRNKFPNTEVLIWYEREPIKDINALFKWGKVKHGTPILFSVAGTNIGAVSKLKRYLYEGASPRFESFLVGVGPNQILDLF